MDSTVTTSGFTGEHYVFIQSLFNTDLKHVSLGM